MLLLFSMYIYVHNVNNISMARQLLPNALLISHINKVKREQAVFKWQIKSLLLSIFLSAYLRERLPNASYMRANKWPWPLLCFRFLYEITPRLIPSAHLGNHASPCSPLFKHKSTWKADFLLLRGSRFLLSTEKPGQNNNCWQIMPGTIRRSFDLHVIFMSPLFRPF